MHETIQKLLRPHYRDMAGYVSAGMEVRKTEDKIFLNANENPYELPGIENCNRYPEPQPLKLLEALARLYEVKPENIVATRGADEAIVLITRLFCEPYQDKILINPPTFGMYKVDADAIPAAGVVEMPLVKENGAFHLDVEGIKAALNSEPVKLVFLCSPNNPTANIFPQKDMLEICQAAAGKAMVVVDETYNEFTRQPSCTTVMDEFPNLLVLRTLSKSYSMAGQRIGCMLSGDTGLVQMVRQKGLDAYPLPVASVQAALKVCTPEIQKIANDNIKKLLEERDRMRTALEKSPQVTLVYPSDANFLLVEMDNAKGFYEHAFAQNIILRDFSSKPGIKNCLRISIGLPEENDRVLALLDDFAVKQAKAG